MHSPRPRFTAPACGRSIRLLFVGVTCCLFVLPAEARVSLEALVRDGYGMAEMKRPHPNVLTVSATIDGRRATLIVDTGWSGEGITLQKEFGKHLQSPVQDVDDFGRSATGKALVKFKKGVADTVSLGNVQMRRVPISFGKD